MERGIDYMIESQDKWFVWTKTGRHPVFVHADRDAAVAEAKRLALMARNRGKKFHVLHAVAKVSAVEHAPAIPKDVLDSLEPNAVVDAHAAASRDEPNV